MTRIEFTDIYVFDEFLFERRAGGLFRLNEAGSATPVALGSRALDLLAFLIRRNGEPVAKDEIMTVVWSGRAVEETNLNVQISKLRHVLDQDRPTASCIQTITGYGYRFTAAVTQVDGSVPPRSGLLADQADGPDAARQVEAQLPCWRSASAAVTNGIRASLDRNGFDGDAHALLMSIYRDARQPIELRIEAAKAALPFERPRVAPIETRAVDDTRRSGDGKPDDMGLPARPPAKLTPERHDAPPRRLSLAASR
jgi:DNA-binding winged helix-turn-helix (wHTH) protein